MNLSYPYLPGTPSSRPGPLARFLLPIEEGCVASWLTERLRAGEWVLEPFGVSPLPAVEAARAGYRVLVAANNPVTRFLLECYANPPSAADLKAALAELAASRKGDERLETHIQSFYLTECANCRNTIIARAFLWRKGAEYPYARIYTCPACGEHGERLITPADVERTACAAETAKLHRARVLERVAPLEDPDREYAEEALNHYLPRPLYALTTLINRLDSLELSPERRQALQLLLLAACDAANDLWPHPTERPRPKQLATPAQFREHNLWLAMEQAIELWPEDGHPVQLTRWPQAPTGAGICLFNGRLKDLSLRLKDIPLQAVVAAVPRPNQAFWTLSALWAGWLWGREAAAPFKPVLRRRRYDWEWHAEALLAAFGHLSRFLAPGVPFLGLATEVEPPFLTAMLIAADLAGFDLQTLAIRTAHDPLQIGWTRRPGNDRTGSPADPRLARTALQQYLRDRGEAVSYLHLHAAGLAALAENGCLSRNGQPIGNLLSEAASALQQALSSGELIHYEAASHGLETGLWGLSFGQEQAISLPDRVEIETVRFLARHPDSTLLEIERGLYPLFPGLHTPPTGLLQAVLTSYALQTEGRWHLRPEDDPVARRSELRQMTTLIQEIGRRLEYDISTPEKNIVLWQDKGETAYVFYVTASAVAGRCFANRISSGGQNLLVLPGGRAGLLAYKLRRDPALHQTATGWRFIKFRLLRALAEIPLLTRQTWEEQINSDPIEHMLEQMMMF